MTSNKHWIYLEQLRRSGVTNMYGASPYLQEKFNISYEQAREILVEWMEHYNPEDYED